jgi:hypothetical protein
MAAYIIIASAWRNKFWAWVVAGVMYPQLNQKNLSVIIASELSEFNQIFKLFQGAGARFIPASVICCSDFGPVLYSPEIHLFYVGELLPRQKFLGDYCSSQRPGAASENFPLASGFSPRRSAGFWRWER